MTVIKINGTQKELLPPITGREIYQLAKEVVGFIPNKVKMADTGDLIQNDENPITILSGQEFTT